MRLLDRSRGYSLFEVLIAFTIMSMSLSIILPAQSQLVLASRDAPDLLVAQDFAYGQIAAYGVLNDPSVGTTEYVHGTWRVVRVVERHPDAIELFRVKVIVSDQQNEALSTAEMLVVD